MCPFRFNPDRLSVVVGTDNREKGGVRYRVKNIVVHDDYQELRKHDIALLHTDKIKLGPKVQPVQLERGHVGGNEDCVLTGNHLNWFSIFHTVTFQAGATHILCAVVNYQNTFKPLIYLQFRMICVSV